VPCGIDDKAVTSMQMELGKEVNINQVKDTFTHYFIELFEASIK
jgi:lipoyl(octanoyl) transferase